VGPRSSLLKSRVFPSKVTGREDWNLSGFFSDHFFCRGFFKTRNFSLAGKFGLGLGVPRKEVHIFNLPQFLGFWASNYIREAKEVERG